MPESQPPTEVSSHPVPLAASHRSAVIVVLPAYNEEANIAKLLDRIQRAMEDASLRYRVVVVDDGSIDQTGAILEEYRSRLPLEIARHKVNQGLGATIRDGIYLAAKSASKNDIIVTMDSDETHPPGLIARMVGMIREGHDVVIASRYQPGGRVCGLTLGRRMVSYFASLMCRVVFPTKGVRDYTCGFRAYRGEVLHQALARYGEGFIQPVGFQCMVDILLKLRRNGAIMGEAPLILRYDLKRGQSKMKLARTAFGTMLLLARHRIGKPL
jgi:dolichol-phosphate mannosyltransferase